MKQYILYLMLILLCVADGIAQSRSRRSNPIPDTGITTNIRQIDFKNFTYDVGGKKVKLRNGEYEDQELTWRLDRNQITDQEYLVYGDLTGDGSEEAAIVLAYEGMSLGAGTVVQRILIYTLRNGQVTKLADFESGGHGCSEEGVECDVIGIKIESGLLIVDRAVPGADDSRCCPSLYRSTKYHWNSDRFIEISKTPLRRTPKN